jgi:hypothetical protein
MNSASRLLTINAHEAWVYQLGHLGAELDIIDGMPGRYCGSWDLRIRPIPSGARLVKLDEVLARQRFGQAPPYDCVIAHSVTDLMDLREIEGSRILVIHVTLEGRARNEGHGVVPAGFARSVAHYLDMIGGQAMAVSNLKARSWGMDVPVVSFGVDVDAYPAHRGTTAEGIRVANQVSARKEYLLWDFYERAFANIPVRLVGHNPDMLDVAPAENWDHLKLLLSEHRFFVHTAHPELEDGYNMATVEAMAAGLPILGNRHPSSPIEHGVTGFVADNPMELADYAKRLLADSDLAHKMGQAARETASARFSIRRFVDDFRGVLQLANQRWSSRFRA